MKRENAGNGIGIASLLTVAFVILKLIGIISWSWWWVVSPIWICALICIACIILVAIVSIVKK